MATAAEGVQVVPEFDFGDPKPNAVGRNALVPTEGCVVHLEANSAKRLLWSGEDLLDVTLPAGTRVIYPKPTIPGLSDRDRAIRHALGHCAGMDAFGALLQPGMKVTIAIDDISLPLPKMPRPDIRESVLTILLDILAAKGVSDVHIIIATSFHRRMEAFEIRHIVGGRIFDAYYPHNLYNHDGEDPDGMVELGQTELGERVRINRRAAESGLLVYVNINLVPMDGGHKSVAVGLCDYPSLQAHHTPQAILESDSYFDHTRSPLTDSCNRMGKVVNDNLNVFHIETVLNNAMFHPAMEFFVKNEDHYTALDKALFKVSQWSLRQLSRSAKRKVLFAVPASYEPIAIHAGATGSYPPQDAGVHVSTVLCSHRRPKRRCYLRHPLYFTLQRQLHLEPGVGAGVGFGILLQHVSRDARCEEERCHDPDAPAV